MFNDSTRRRFLEADWVLLRDLEKVIESLEADSADSYAFSLTRDPVAHFNAYIDFAIAVYLDKFKQLYQCVMTSIEREWYLVYAQAGRSILENAATLRYYARHEDFSRLVHAWQKGAMTDALMRQAALRIDQFIRGSRFSWDALVQGRFDQLSKNPEQEHLAQVNVQTCLQKWYRDSRNLESLYDLMCDLVHPNIGSTFLVVRAQDGSIVAGGKRGDNQAPFVVAPTLKGIIGAYKEIQNAINQLDEAKLSTGA